MDKVIIIVGALLIVYAIWQTIQKMRGKAKSSCCGGAEAPTRKTVADTDETHYSYRYRLAVGGMHCSHCAVNVENALNSMPGVWGRVNLAKNEFFRQYKGTLAFIAPGFGPVWSKRGAGVTPA